MNSGEMFCESVLDGIGVAARFTCLLCEAGEAVCGHQVSTKRPQDWMPKG